METVIGGNRSLSELKAGERAVVAAVPEGTGITRRLCDLGFTSGETVRCVGVSPLGDPKAFMVRGAVIALRSEDAGLIAVREAEI